jgi:hypothetical protein
MVPAHLVVLDRFPLTGNGKVDRGALPEPELDATAQYTAPRNQVEADLAEAWAKVLGRQKVGIDDNYFALGGDSIRSIQVLALSSPSPTRTPTPAREKSPSPCCRTVTGQRFPMALRTPTR